MQTKLKFDNEKNKYFLALSSVCPNSPYLKAKLFEFFEYDIQKTFLLNENDLKEFTELYPNVKIPKKFLSELKSLEPDKIYDNIVKSGTKFITYEDKNYPILLKNIEDFPLVLYYKGNFNNINFDRTLGVVGSRNATESAKQNVRKLVSGLKNTDVTIVSGLACGIDAMSHIAALENNIKTIAVIGSGLNYKYPSQNVHLYEKIENGGGIIFSEFVNDIPPMPQNFPQRNRIVTGLSKGIIIAEAKMKSGAMISAKYALEQGRELMCIPGLISNPNCEGIYHLIKQGAGIVVGTEDILNILNWEIIPHKSQKISLTADKKRIYDAISKEEISFEGLKQKLDVDINELMIKLTEMELEGLIIQKNGIYYITGI